LYDIAYSPALLSMQRQNVSKRIIQSDYNNNNIDNNNDDNMMIIINNISDENYLDEVQIFKKQP
jgi:hypothetical protein